MPTATDYLAALAHLDAIPDQEWERVMGSQGRPEFARLVIDSGQDVEAEWLIAQIRAGVRAPGMVYNYQTGAEMRRATVEEDVASIRAMGQDDGGGTGAIMIDGVACYVD